MGDIDHTAGKQLHKALQIEPNESLWKRVPKHCEDGKPLGDFMMLIPGLNKKTPADIQERLSGISAVLCLFEKIVVFADLNMKLNLLWISHKPVPGSSIDISVAIQEKVPEARLVGIKFD